MNADINHHLLSSFEVDTDKTSQVDYRNIREYSTSLPKKAVL